MNADPRALEFFAARRCRVSSASTANAKDGTIDVVWYSGATVPRIDRATGEPYMLSSTCRAAASTG